MPPSLPLDTRTHAHTRARYRTQRGRPGRPRGRFHGRLGTHTHARRAYFFVGVESTVDVGLAEGAAVPDPKAPPARVLRSAAQQQRFQTMSDGIIGKIDEMGGRIDELEKSIGDIMQQAGIEDEGEGEGEGDGDGEGK